MITHDRYFLDNVVEWILEPIAGRTTLRRQLLDLSREEGQASRAGKPRGKRALQGAVARTRMDPADAQRAPDQVEGAYPQVRGTAGRPEGPQAGQGADRYPGPRTARRQGDRGQEHFQGLRRQAALRKPVLHAAPGRHRRRDRPQRRGQVDAVQDPHRQGRTRQRHGGNRSDRPSQLCRPEPRPSQSEEQRLGGNLRRAGLHEGQRPRHQHARPMSAHSTSRARTSRRMSANCRGASATACTWPRC